MSRQMMLVNLGSLNLVVVTVILATTIMKSTVVEGDYTPSYFSYTPSYSDTPSDSYTPSTDTTPWQSAHATFYGDDTGSATLGGACGYGSDSGYGLETAALSSVMFNNGKACGTCYEIKCVDSPWCFDNGDTITITATNLCPPNWYQSSDAGGWCNPPRSHFDLSKPMFMKIAQWTAGIVPVSFRKVSCVRTGGIRFNLQGNPYWLLVSVMNVAGSGDVSQMWVKTPQTDWISMSQNWGASYQAFAKLVGSLTFKLINGDGKTIICDNVTPQYWSTGQTYQSANNFY